MTTRRMFFASCAVVLAASVLFLAGAFRFATTGADAAVGSAGPLEVSAAPTANLSDGQVVGVHVQAKDGVSIYSLTAHVCMPGKVNGDHTFDYSGPFCSSLPIGQGDVQPMITTTGTPSADLSAKVGTGTVGWTNERGFPYTLTCDATSPCDLVVRAEITNSTTYIRIPLCFGTACPPDVSLVLVSPNAPAGVVAPPSPAETAAPVAAAPAAANSSPTTTSAPRAAPLPTATVPGRARSSGDGDLAAARDASVVSPTGGPSRGLSVFVSALAGAVAAIFIVHAVSRARRRTPRAEAS